jgi:hypothetical protein
VLLLLHEGGAANPVLRLAHGGCSESGVQVMDDAMRVDLGAIWPAKAWLRPHPAQPRAVVLIGPRATAMRVTAGGEVIDRLCSMLLGMGFGLLTDLETPLPHSEGLAVRLGPGNQHGHQLAVLDTDDIIIWDGALEMPDGWTDAARAAGRVGVVFTSGLDLPNPHRDHLADLTTAIRAGSVVGATAELL